MSMGQSFISWDDFVKNEYLPISQIVKRRDKIDAEAAARAAAT